VLPIEEEDERAPTLEERVFRLLAAPGRILGVLFTPDRTLPRAVAEHRYAAPMLVVMAMGLVAALVIGVRLDVSRMGPPGGGPGGPGGQRQQQGQQQQEQAQRPSNEPQEQPSEREIGEEQAKRKAMVQVTSALGAGVGVPVLILLQGIGLFLVALWIRAPGAKFMRMLPSAVKSAILAAAVWPYDSITPMQVDSISGSARFLLMIPDPLLGGIAAHVDVFAIWSFIILVFGFGAAAAVSRKKAFFTILVCFVLVQLVWAAAGGPPPGAGAR